MRKFNINSLLVIFAVIFIITGIWGQCFTRLKWATIDMLAALKHGNIYSVFDFKVAVDRISDKELSYHDTLMDLDSIRNNAMGTRVIQKDDTTVVKSSSGSLIEPVMRIDDSEIDKVVLRLLELKTVAEENGAQFLYCAAPRKECYEEAPHNIQNYAKDNFERFISAMNKAEIPTLDFSKTLADEGIADNDIFYETDHHWKARCGFIATKAICEKLSSLYGFAVDEQAKDLNNYSITKYDNMFLGSKGKKVGTFFTWKGRDDFELITPNFETDMREEQPFKNSKREGTFEETALFLKSPNLHCVGKQC